MSREDFTCERCGVIAFRDEFCPHGNCQDCQQICCRETEIKMAMMCDFAKEANALREKFPKFAKEIDKCIFDVGQNYLRSCGHADCDCQISFADFHAERNRIFGTEKIYEFN